MSYRITSEILARDVRFPQRAEAFAFAIKLGVAVQKPIRVWHTQGEQEDLELLVNVKEES